MKRFLYGLVVLFLLGIVFSDPAFAHEGSHSTSSASNGMTPPTFLDLVVVFHIIGAVLGVGGSFCTDLHMIHTIRDGVASKQQVAFLKKLSGVVIAGLLLLVTTGLIQYFGYHPEFDQKYPAFKAKLTLVTFLIANGVFFHIFVFPLIWKHPGESLRTDRVQDRLWRFALTGAFSSVSWWSVLLLGLLFRHELPLGYGGLLVVYGGLVAGAFFIGWKVLKGYIG